MEVTGGESDGDSLGDWNSRKVNGPEGGGCWGLVFWRLAGWLVIGVGLIGGYIAIEWLVGDWGWVDWRLHSD